MEVWIESYYSSLGESSITSIIETELLKSIIWAHLLTSLSPWYTEASPELGTQRERTVSMGCRS